VGILTGQAEEALVAAGACHIIRDYHELMELLAR
jgi:phosphoglycolate phosphatase-like HAD superfamily hydrolase